MTATTRAVRGTSRVVPAIIDFRERPDSELLREFHERCRLAFPPHHMEDLSTWEEDLLGEPDADGPRRHLLLAVGGTRGTARRRLLAGHLFEYYPQSRCGLLSYIHVGREHRGQGLGRALLERAVRDLTDAATVGGGDLRAVFAESLDPAEASVAEAGEAWTRHEILTRLGARILRLPYVAPALGPERDRARDLLLMDIPDARPGDEALHQEVLLEFLAEFYQALGVADPDADPDFGRMKAALDEPFVATVELRREQPAVSMPSVSIALHFVRRDGRSELPSDAGPLASLRRVVRWGEPGAGEAAVSTTETLPRDPTFRSLERDLVSHAFHDPEPFGSEALREPIDAVVTFPRQLTVESEGRTIRLWAAGQQPDGAGRSVRLRVLRSRTRFGSGVVVEHLVLTNMGLVDAALNEFDVVKLLKLIKDAGDASNVVEEIRFAGPAADQLPLDAWLAQLPPSGRAIELQRETLRAATVLIVTGDDAAWGPLYGLVSRLADEGDEVAGEFRTLLGGDKAPQLTTAERLKATEGVVCSLLNFGDIDHWELADALEPALGSSDYLIWLQKANLVCLTREDRLTTVEAIRRDIGASPYLLAPHAVLLHNEEILRHTREALDAHDRRETPDTSRRALASLRALVDENLRRHLLPNVFHYRTERELFARGQQDRGLVEQTAALERRLEQLKGKIDAAASRAQARQDRVLTFIFGLLSATVIGDIAITVLNDDTRWQLGIYVGSLLVVFVVAVVLVWRAGRH